MRDPTAGPFAGRAAGVLEETCGRGLALNDHRRRMKPEEQARRVVELWQDRPKSQRTSDDVLAFYGWLSDHESGLVPNGPGSYQAVRAIVAPFIVEPAPDK